MEEGRHCRAVLPTGLNGGKLDKRVPEQKPVAFADLRSLRALGPADPPRGRSHSHLNKRFSFTTEREMECEGRCTGGHERAPSPVPSGLRWGHCFEKLTLGGGPESCETVAPPLCAVTPPRLPQANL
ncbi:hypothetical protein SKAU_G00090430 [Synaphobranchus kaupii]|uniref:Uncharacterized protein n=1 Tax=Synaphobranchus kaupii TaxID=118154 RepID=A0A9Q1J492_SYNKA|nr:hypothetical protein SKAU_G00090430 [Synaphobranchus kaupii]